MLVRISLTTVLLLGAAAQLHAQPAISWTANAQNLRASQQREVIVVCPPGGRPGTVWGTNTYTDDSSICTAAVHAGVINFVQGGKVAVQLKPGLRSYVGSVRNGVSSSNYDTWDASFSVRRYIEPLPEEPEPAPPPPPPPPPPAPPRIPEISWQRDAVGLAPNGRRFTFMCRPPAAEAVVKGVDLYSWESSICNAAVHAGAITRVKGGSVTIEMRPGLSQYPASTRNGVTSAAGARTILGFVIVTDSSSTARK